MKELTPAQKNNLIKISDFIKTELSDLAVYNYFTFNDYKTKRTERRNLERIAENISNAVIDISKILLSASEFDSNMPETYREIILKLGEENIIPFNLAEQLTNIARLRNILAHQYLDIKWDYLKKFADTYSKDVEKLVEIVDNFINL